MSAGAAVCWLEYARAEGPAAFLTRGPTATARYDGTVSGLLVRHPQGDVVIDVGNEPGFLDHLDGYGPFTKLLIRQLPGRAVPVASVSGAIAFVGGEADAVRWIVGTHAHLDHLGGIGQLPGPPVLLGADELPFVRSLVDAHTLDLLPSQAAALVPRMQAVTFDGPPVGPFPASHDLYGDGAIVLVPLPGHTPGSLGALIDVDGAPRILDIGDVAMIAEGYEKPAPKGFLVRRLDHDRAATAEALAKVHALHQDDPALVILPAHDRTAWVGLFGPTPRCVGDTLLAGGRS